MSRVLPVTLLCFLAGACNRTPPVATTGTGGEANREAPKTPPAYTGPTRTEKDLLGSKEIPADAYYGVQSLRAIENFPISGTLINQYPGFVEAWAIVKLAAARANTQVGAMKQERLDMIEKAVDSVMKGNYHDQFRVDWYQGGAGTSTNMNANEVLANVGLELSGHKRGEYQFLEPHDDLEHVAVDERFVSDGDQGRADPAQRQADRRS